MTKQKIVVVLFLILYFSITLKAIAQDGNAGFISGNIWYSVDSIKEGEKIQIYTAIFNPDSRQFSGTISFFDKNSFLGKKNFVAKTKGVEEIYIDWVVTVGEHDIFAKIENAKFLNPDNKYTEIYLDNDETIHSKILVETKKEITDTNKGGGETPSGISKLVSDNTPETVKTVISNTIDAVEGFRTETSDKLENKEETLRIELNQASKETLDSVVRNVDVINDPSNQNKVDASKTENKKTVFIKPFKYIELFFLMLITSILHNQVLFYLTIALLLFLLFKILMR